MRRPGPEAQLTAVLGPTNTGKTHLAIERMLGRSSGVIGLPLRLLAREVYDRICREKGPAAAALITGEEKIVPPGARYFACTVEAMPLDRNTAFVAIDEVQLAADPERGHVFTDRLLNARGTEETMFLGAETLRPLIRTLAPDAAYDRRERFSTLTYVGEGKLAKLPKRTAIVAFSAAQVYAIAELLRRQRGGAAVVMGALSPRTRNAQVALYQSGEVDYLVATDAIGMGLNLDVDHVAFASLSKFDGRRRRPLRPEEIAQIAGRAGRFRSDGTFGVTAEAPPLTEETVQRVEAHEFEPLSFVHWRESDLDFSSVDALLRSLARPSPERALKRVREAGDEIALDALARDADIAPAIRSPALVRRLWDACQIPDFRKVTVDRHVQLVASFARHLTRGEGVAPVSWIAAEVDKLDKPSGDVDALSSRLAHIRTWTYAANRSDWVADPEHWRGVTRGVEDRLSDALHEKLTERFVDRRTSALIRGLNAKSDLAAEIAADGDVVVEGHHVGRLVGLVFQPDVRGGALEAKALRAAADAALRPLVDRRLGRIAADDGDGLTLRDDLAIHWRGEKIARLVAGPTPLAPRVALIGGELGAQAARERAARRMEAWLRADISDALAPLERLTAAIDAGALTGLARGLAYRLAENLGSLDRAEAETEIAALSAAERRSLRAAGVRFGPYDLFLPALVRPKPARLAALLYAAAQPKGGRAFLPAPGRTSLPAGNRAAAAFRAAGYRKCGPLAVRLDILDRLSDLVREERGKDGAKGLFEVTPGMTALLGCSREDMAGALRALGFRRAQKAKPAPQPTEATETSAAAAGPASPELWRPGRPKRPQQAKPRPTPPADGPFAALAGLSAASPTGSPAPRRRRKPRPSS